MKARGLAGAIAALALLVCSGCSFVSSWPTRGEAPEVHVVQVTPIVESETASGAVDLEYELFVRNPFAEALELTSVDIRTAGVGAYVMRNQHVDVRGLVPPRRTRVIRFVTRAWYRGGPVSVTQPVRIEGVARFLTPSGVCYCPFKEVIP